MAHTKTHPLSPTVTALLSGRRGDCVAELQDAIAALGEDPMDAAVMEALVDACPDCSADCEPGWCSGRED